MRALLDTNIVLYLLGDRLADALEPGEYYVSVISEIELLSYPRLDAAAEHRIRAFLAEVNRVELSPRIRELAVQLRRQHALKIPDAIVAASAMTLGATLLTNDLQLLKIAGLDGRSLTLRDTEKA